MYFSFLYFVLILIKYFEGFYSTDTTFLSIEVVMICLFINIMLHVTLKKILVIIKYIVIMSTNIGGHLIWYIN